MDKKSKNKNIEDIIIVEGWIHDIFNPNDDVRIAYYDENNEFAFAEIAPEKLKEASLYLYEGESFNIKTWEENGEAKFQFLPKPDAKERYQEYLKKEAERKANDPTKKYDLTDPKQFEQCIKELEKHYGDFNWSQKARGRKGK